VTHIIERFITSSTNIAPLITFRILFGALMMIGAIRFMQNGWIEKLYLEPRFFFKFYGFEWVTALNESGMYFLFWTVIISSACIMLGLFYRLAAITFFLSFSYIELIDATNYLNHYYLVCLFGFLLIFLPANRNFSLDVKIWPSLKATNIPSWTINILILQLTIVYTCAGIAKLNYDWIVNAMPLTIWLPEHTKLPILGYFFQFKWAAYLFSWGGALYDLTIAYFLMNSKTRPWAYIMVVIFHLLTYALFNIGLFPFIMIFSTLIFFPASFHQKILGWIGYKNQEEKVYDFNAITKAFIRPILMVFIFLQVLLPFRHLLYAGNILWNEEGYRFSWRVMLVEKIGQATFYIEDKEQKRKTEIVNGQFLTQFQEKQMCIQPDFILQFAQFLKEEFKVKHGMKNPIIKVDAHVALNGRTSKRLIDSNTNLAKIKDGFRQKKWILPFEVDLKPKHQ